jgi:hypothetical protein
MSFLKGKKTFLISGLTVLFAVAGALTHQFDWNHAAQLILGAGGLAGLRDAHNA